MDKKLFENKSNNYNEEDFTLSENKLKLLKECEKKVEYVIDDENDHENECNFEFENENEDKWDEDNIIAIKRIKYGINYQKQRGEDTYILDTILILARERKIRSFYEVEEEYYHIS